MSIIAAVTVYKSEDYVVVTEVKQPKGGWQSSGVSKKNPQNISACDLGTIILEAIVDSEASQNTESKPIEFWKTLGYKTFSSFSKKHEMLDISKYENKYRVMRWRRGTRGYSPSQDSKDSIDLSLNLTPEELGKAVQRLFCTPVDSFSDEFQFNTINDSVVSYQLHRYFGFEDLGDGHTDAYQIYADTQHPTTHLAFMIDSGYESFSESDMKRSFEQYYGSLLEYNYQVYTDRQFKVKVEAKTEAEQIVSYLFEDGADFLEVIYVIDLKTSEGNEENIRQEFEAVVQSVKLRNLK